MRLSTDTVSGVLFAVIGGAGLAIAFQYKPGTATNMGPGFFPMLVSAGIMVLGGVLALRSMRQVEPGALLGKIHLKPLAIILCGIVLFGMMIQSAGLFFALAALVVTSGVATGNKRPFELVSVFLVLALLAYGIFVFGLKIPLKVFP